MLTINEENRLRRKIQNLEKKDNEIEVLRDQGLGMGQEKKETDKQFKDLESKVHDLEQLQKELMEELRQNIMKRHQLNDEDIKECIAEDGTTIIQGSERSFVVEDKVCQ